MLSQRTSSSPRSSSACRPQLVFLLAVAAAFLRSVHTQCGESRPQELRAAQVPRFFTSPDFGRSSTYPKNATCEWVIRASANNRQIQLEVVSSDLEAPLFSECDDVVSVRDGANNETSRSLSEWCGERRQSSTPLVLISSSDSLSVNFRSDDFFELRGFNITYQEFQVPGCPPYWTELDDSCYRPFLGNNQHLPWVEAQTECTFAYANLMTVSSEEEYEFLTGMIPRQHSTWLGYHDSLHRGQLESLVSGANLWPSSAAGTHHGRDCLALDRSAVGPEGLAYWMADCRERRGFVCKRSVSGRTLPVPPPRALVREGYTTNASSSSVWTWWWLLLIILLLLLIIFLILCCRWAWNRLRVRSQVGTIERNHRLVRDVEGGAAAARAQSRQGTPRPSSQRAVPPVPVGKKPTSPVRVVDSPSTGNDESGNRRHTAASQRRKHGHHHRTQQQTTEVEQHQQQQQQRKETPDVQPKGDLAPSTSNAPANVVTVEPLPPDLRASTTMEMRELPSASTTAMLLTTAHQTRPPSGQIATSQISPSLLPIPTIDVGRESVLKTARDGRFERPKKPTIDNISAISLDEFWKTQKTRPPTND